MNTLEYRLKNLALDAGAAVVGIASRERMIDFPVSGDPGYLMPSARALISFAIPFEKRKLRDYFGKTHWRGFGNSQKRILQTLYTINDKLVSFLTGEGHEALGVNGNCTYRPERGVEDFTEMTEFVPDFSHQYGAVAAGLGRLGWSGNLLTPEYGAAILLGTVLTTAKLKSDPLCEGNPCDRCGFCTQVCPVEMMDRKRSVNATVAGITEEIAIRKPHSRCWIGCGDYHGLSPDRKWSNWSPYRVDHPLPDDKDELDAFLIRLRKADPESGLYPNPYTDHRAVTFDPAWSFSATCGNCANICWKDREDRKKNMNLIFEGGVVALQADGTRKATREEIMELDTPYGVKVAVSASEYDKIRDRKVKQPGYAGDLEKDQRVLEYLHQDKKNRGLPG